MMNIVPTNIDKRVLRSQLLSLRLAMRPHLKQQHDDAICRGVRSLIYARHELNAVVALYAPIRGEPDLMPLADELLAAGFMVVLPVVVEKNAPLKFAQYTREDALVVSSLGILEPDLSTLNAVLPDVVVVPCVGFDGKGHRLGYGGGFYDRTLAAFKSVGHEPMTIGVAYDEALVAFAVDAFDLPMDEIITPMCAD